MKKLHEILQHIEVLDQVNSLDSMVEDIVLDSRFIVPNSLFVAIKGANSDGHLFIDSAIKNGAKFIVCEIFPEEFRDHVCYILVKNSSIACGIIASAFFDFPSNSLKIVGITGTNGKTTTATLLYNLLSEMGFKCGLISTIRIRIADKTIDATHTTPDTITLHRYFKQMVEAGCEYCFMEVSSHAVDQNRIAGVYFTGAVFTNITHDHLDYHITFDNYIKAKKSFFDGLSANAFALTNIDDRNGMIMLQNTAARKYSYALKTMSDFKGKLIHDSMEGMLLEINGKQVHCRLVGAFNAYNLLAVNATATLLGMVEDEILLKLSNLDAADGRFQFVKDGYTQRSGVVDYAHTPDALEKLIDTIKEIKFTGSKIITVVGCGGDRDKAKRPIMGKIAAVRSDIVILTSDNPRSENPDSIVEEMFQGIDDNLQSKVIKIIDRAQALKTACMLANEKDIIVVAGKGHEKYQEIKGVKVPFDDVAILEKEMSESAH